MTVTHTCEVESCANPAKRETVCRSCGDRLAQALGDVPALADELEVTLTRQAVITTKGDGSRSAETPLVFHYGASEARWVLRNTLSGWVRVLMEEAG